MKRKKLQFRIREFSQGGYAVDRKIWKLFWLPVFSQPQYGFDKACEAKAWLDAYVKQLEVEFIERNRPKYEQEVNYEISFNMKNFLWLQR